MATCHIKLIESSPLEYVYSFSPYPNLKDYVTILVQLPKFEASHHSSWSVSCSHLNSEYRRPTAPVSGNSVSGTTFVNVVLTFRIKGSKANDFGIGLKTEGLGLQSIGVGTIRTSLGC